MPLVSKVFEIYGLRSLIQEKCFLVKKVTEDIAKTTNLPDEQMARILVDKKMEYIEKAFTNKAFTNPASVVIEDLDNDKK